MLAKDSICKRYRLLLPFLLTGWFMVILLQTLPHHHHDDVRLCMGKGFTHCDPSSPEKKSCKDCCDMQVPCVGQHVDIQKPPLQQESGKPQALLVAILLSSDNSELVSPTGVLVKSRVLSFLFLYSAKCARSIGLRAPPVLVV